MVYTAEIKRFNLDGRVDELVLLTSSNGEQVWISNRAASIEELALLSPDKRLGRMVFGHHDAVAGSRQEQPLTYTEQAHRDSSQSRRNKITDGGVPIIFLPGRLYGGQICFLQTDGTYAQFAVPNSHSQFGSLLHLGGGKNADFKISDPKIGRDYASVTFTQDKVGEILYPKGFPQGISAEVTYTLQNGVLTREVTHTNNTDNPQIYLLIVSSDHSSLMPGIGNATDLSVLLKTNGEYELDSVTKVATGRMLSGEAMFDSGKVVNIKGAMEHMYRVAKPSVEIMNTKQKFGLRIEADPKTKVAYVWVPKTNNFLSVQFYNGQPTAALSIPAFPPVEGMDPIFKQTIEGMLAPGKSITYRQTFRAINEHSRN